VRGERADEKGAQQAKFNKPIICRPAALTRRSPKRRFVFALGPEFGVFVPFLSVLIQG